MTVKAEVAEIMKTEGQVYEWASKIEYKRELTSEEKEISEVVDAWAKEIGNKGSDPDCEIANFIVKTIEPEVYDRPDELLDSMFNRGSVGEFDDVSVIKNPKNTLVAHDAAKGGNVDKSYIDTSLLTPVWSHKQVETEVSYADLRRNGYRSIATLTTFAQESLKDQMISDIFTVIDNAIVGSDQVISVTGSSPAKTDMDELALYVIDRVLSGDDPFCFGLNKYAQAIANISGYTSFMSDNMKDDFNRYGLIKFYQGMRIAGISGAKKTAKGDLLVPDKRIFGVAGKIGNLDMRGNIRVYETPDNNRELFQIKVTGFEFGHCVTDIEKVAKVTFTA